MERGASQSHGVLNSADVALATGPRLPGQGGAMAYMDTVADLVRRYRSEHGPAEPPLRTATAVLAWAGSGLPDEVKDRLVLAAAMAVREGDFPEVHLSPRLAEEIRAKPETWVLSNWRAWPAPDQDALMALGLLQWERDMTWDEYKLRYHSGDAHQARLLLFMGWMPGTLVAAVAGIVVALIVGNLWLFPVIALTGTILGFLATFAAWAVVAMAEERWLRLGDHWWTAFGLVVLGTGPAVALLVALLVLSLA
jgi:hypothetical protein